MKAMKLTAVAVGIGLMLCGCGNEASSDAGHQKVRQYASTDGNYGHYFGYSNKLN